MRWPKAEVIVCLDADILGSHPEAVSTQGISQGPRTGTGKMSRLYVAEPTYSITGAAADHRLPVRCQRYPRFAPRWTMKSAHWSAGESRTEASKNAFIRAAGVRSCSPIATGCVIAGPRQPADVRAAVHHINCLITSSAKLATLVDVLHARARGSEQPSYVEAIRISGRRYPDRQGARRC